MSKEYLLRHQDKAVVEFSIDEVSRNVNSVQVLEDTFSPVNVLESDVSKAVSLNGWLLNRCMPNSREGVQRIQKKYGVEDLKEAMIVSYGLSLSDHFWIDREPYDKVWKNINLFENRYDEKTGKMLFDPKLKLVDEIRDLGYRNPGFTSGGVLQKFWRYNEGEKKNYLIKGGSRPDEQEPFNEYFAHLLLQELDFNHTRYMLGTEDGKYVSACPCIADKATEMVSAVDLQRKYRIGKNYEGFVGIGQKKGCVGFKDEVNKMIILDYLIDNIDRHWNNFGILRDTNSGSWKGLIPVFDNGCSLWNKDFVDSRLVSESMSFADSNVECVKMVDIYKYVKKLPDLVRIFDKAFESYHDKERKAALRKGLGERQEQIERYMDCQKQSVKSEVKEKGKKI